MRLLVDTHVFLWFVAGDRQLSEACRAVMEAPENELFISVGSLWEMAIKLSIGKLTLPGDYGTFIAAQLAENDIEILAVTLQHVEQVSRLPFHYRDPFDRLLVAQALTEGMSIVSQDAALDEYGVTRIG